MLQGREPTSYLECLLKGVGAKQWSVDEILNQLQTIISALDKAGETLAAVYIQTAVDIIERLPHGNNT